VSYILIPYSNKKTNIPSLLPKQQSDTRLPFSPTTAMKLQTESTFRGHRGCVNRLHWNQDGSFLASGSDDRTIRIWPYPGLPDDTQRHNHTTTAPPTTATSTPSLLVTTEHISNIFGVRFLPHCNSSSLVSGGMDGTVQYHRLEAGPADSFSQRGRRRRYGRPQHHTEEEDADGDGFGPPSPSSSQTTTTTESLTTSYTCHQGRVKDVEVSPDSPHLFWSAAEDGAIRQFDTRISTSSQDKESSPNKLIKLTNSTATRSIELKSLGINKVRTEQLAVVADDAYVRMYDRRMLGRTAPSSNSSNQSKKGLLMRFAPPHLALGIGNRDTHGTHVAFSNRGDKVVATYHGDHGYVFDISSPLSSGEGCRPLISFIKQDNDNNTTNGGGNNNNGSSNKRAKRGDLPVHPRQQQQHWRRSTLPHQPDDQAPGTAPTLPQLGILPVAAERAKSQGDVEAHINSNFPAAIRHYSDGLHIAPYSTSILLARARALLNRGWEGDLFFALSDCEDALSLEPTSEIALSRLMVCLLKCGFCRAVQTVVEITTASGDEKEGSGGVGVKLPDWGAGLEHEMKEKLQRRQIELDRRKKEKGEGGKRGEGEEGERGKERVAEAVAGPSTQNTAAAAAAADVDDVAADDPYESVFEFLHLLQRDQDLTGSNKHTDGADDGFVPELVSQIVMHLDELYAAALKKYYYHHHHQQQDDKEGELVLPMVWQASPGGKHLLQRFIGHANIQTDIKEAAFLGSNDDLVACGSDDGRVFIYDASTGECIKLLQADDDIVNCVQPHPTLPVIATSGIEPVVRLWSPSSDEPSPGGSIAEVVARNQEEMKQGGGGGEGGGGRRLLRRLDARILAALTGDRELLRRIAVVSGGVGDEEGEEEEDVDGGPSVACRVS